MNAYHNANFQNLPRSVTRSNKLFITIVFQIGMTFKYKSELNYKRNIFFFFSFSVTLWEKLSLILLLLFRDLDFWHVFCKDKSETWRKKSFNVRYVEKHFIYSINHWCKLTQKASPTQTQLKQFTLIFFKLKLKTKHTLWEALLYSV